ncbi:MAG TPA: signal recognition particle-docking protein FtsY [Pseudomonadota bacterium]|nr:signal recognition particle-docking protein FtsY [Pseudomonadota bacterium]
MFLVTFSSEPASASLLSGGLVYFLVGVVLVVLVAAAWVIWGRKGRKPVPPQKSDAKTDQRTDPKGRRAPLDRTKPKSLPERATTDAPTPAPGPASKTIAETTPKDDLRAGLTKTRAGFIARIAELLSRKQIGEDLLPELEEVLLSADIGPKTAEHLFSHVRSTLSRSELKDASAIWSTIKEESKRLLQVSAKEVDFAAHSPFVLLVIGVNGVGKTTTIGKLAAQQTALGRKVLLAAGDTFRAAAVEQLEIWGQRANVPVVRGHGGKNGADPSSVIFEAIQRAQKEHFDVVIADTAGRLHVKEQLMAELQKIRRVIKKADPTAPHETWLVLDSTQGQNAIAQARTFKEMMEITGIVLTKLDGTAKGGVILGITYELTVPIRYIGVGEKIGDLRAFDAEEFVDVLYERPGS